MNLLEQPKEENNLAGHVYDAAHEVYRNLGPGLLEAVYKECLIYELKKKGLQVESEISLPIRYKEITVNNTFRIDIWVNRKLIIELKATELIHEVHYAQLLTYLKLSNNKLGLLINFNSEMLRKGIRRVVNRL